jgi:hypothetical protein
MLIDDCQLRTDQIAKFFNTIRVFGWFHHPHDTLAGITVTAPGLLGATSAVGLAHAGVAALGPLKGFSVQILRDADDFPPGITLEFTTSSGRRYRAGLDELAAEATGAPATAELMTRFQAEMHALPQASILDIGGRARSGATRRDLFKVAKYTVLDVLADPSVDVVGDAHTLASRFPPESFDGILSVSVFEHLVMPWAVAVQMNQVLRPGGLAMIFTHQTLGMHDLPWDFWRFSDSAWDALFNPHTGFEIVGRALDRPQFIIPLVYTASKQGAEGAAGYEGSAVLVRKTGPCRMAWPLAAADVTGSMYPPA